MRKTLGAVRRRLVVQFLGESVLFSFISFLISFVLVLISLPVFNAIVERDLNIPFSRIPWFFPAFLGLALLVGLLAGSYPALLLSSFQPVKVFKGSIESGASKSRFRRILVIFQFTVSVILMIGTLTVYKQIDFMKNKKLGFNKEQIVVIPRINANIRQAFQTVQEDILSVPGVLSVGGSSMVPGRGLMKSLFLPEGFTPDQTQTMDYNNIEPHFIPTMGMEMAEGRNFSEEFSTDLNQAVIINETAARKLGWDKPLEKRFVFPPSPGVEGETTYSKVIGVVKDFHNTSLREKIEPMIMFYDTSQINTITVRISPDNITQTVERLKAEWKSISPGSDLNYFFLDQWFDSLYRSEEKTGRLTLYFGVLAILIGCLGLLGLSSYLAERRTKEIGIRKALGASSAGILRLFASEFFFLVLISNIIAWPVAFFFMKKWLRNFAYHMELGPLLFLITGGLTLAVAFAAVGYQAIRAAFSNPAESLRTE